MKRFTILLVAFGLVLGQWTRAQGPDEQYIRIYNLIQDADDLSQSGQRRAAYEQYLKAQSGLQDMLKLYPEWNTKLIQFRLNYLDQKLAQFGPPPQPIPDKPTPAQPTPAQPTPAQPTPAQPTPATDLVEKPAPPADLEAKIRTLTEEVQRLSSDKVTLEAKLREALSAQPATVAPEQLAKAERTILELQKENELLKVSLAQDQAKLSKLVDMSVLDATKKELVEARQKLADQASLIETLTKEKELLQARTRPAEPSQALKLLQEENEFLKARVAELERKVKVPQTEPQTPSPGRPGASSESDQIKKLKQERDELQRKLDQASKSLEKGKAAPGAAAETELTQQLASLQAKLEVLESRKTPYTTEELELFKAPEPALSTTRPQEDKPPQTTQKPIAELPPGAGSIIAEAQRAFAAGRFEEAEKKYMQVLSLDENNAFTLGNLAAIQLEQNRLADAESNLNRALAIEPDDAFNLSLWGILKFRQADFDAAQDALSRAAQLDPNNAETQNYLGIALSQKGQREAAEAALRKAIKLSPNYASAHYNLAIVYATQDPPFMQMAKYHYQKSLSGGHPRNPDLEKVFESRTPAP